MSFMEDEEDEILISIWIKEVIIFTLTHSLFACY